MLKMITWLALTGLCMGCFAESFEPDLTKPWRVYPAGKLSAVPREETFNGKPVFQMNLLKSTGHIGFPLPQKKEFVLKSFSFHAKRLPDSRVNELDVMVRDLDAELYHKRVTLTDQWKKYTFPVNELLFFPYGGAKLVDGKLDRGGVESFRFNNYPAGRHFLVSGFSFEYEKAGDAEAAVPEEKRVFHINPIRMPDSYERYHEKFGPLQDISIHGNRFERNGKPYFMLGVWQLDIEGVPWLMRLNSADVSVYNADEIYTLYSPRRNQQGEPVFSWSPNPWYEAILTRYSANGIRVWHEQKAHPRWSVMRKYREAADVYGAGHFVAYDPYHPQGEACYREMFKSWMRYTRKYPIFCYELFNEMGYFNYHQESRDTFRECMEQKFNRDINAANRAWKTAFRSFADVDAPGYLQDHGKDNLPRESMLLRDGTRYPNLMIDWIKFSERRCYDAVRKLMPVMRSYDPDGNVFSTIQAHLHLGLDYGNGGVPPEALTDFSNFYSHELGQTFVESGNYRDYSYIVGMLKPAMFNDLVRGICPDKPVFNAEAPVLVTNRGANEKSLLASDFADMHAGWKFYDATKGEPENWTAPGYSDSSWGSVTVPAMWAECGYRLCQVGLYRKTFRLSPEQRNGTVYFNGKGFADESEVWINGKKAGSGKGYNTPLTFDITGLVKENNTVCVRIVNRYFADGMYYGGIRGCVSVNRHPLVPAEQRMLEPRHVRSFLWSQAVHGLNGVMYSYTRSQLSPSGRFLAPVKAEINSVADLLFLPENRPSGEVALVYPQEDLRGVVHKDYLVRVTGPATSDIMPYYIPLLSGHYNPSVIRQKNIGENMPFRLLLMPNLRRIQPAAYGRLAEYVRNGGTLVTTFDGLSVNDETHLPFDSSGITGVKTRSFESGSREVSIPGLGSGRISPRYIDGRSSARLEPTTARVLYRFADGTPAVTVNTVGKGSVYTLAANLDRLLVDKFLRSLAVKTGLKRGLSLEPMKGMRFPEYTDTRLFGRTGGSRLLYLLNFDLSGAGVVRLTERLQGNWRLRLPGGNRVISSPSGRDVWSAGELEKGIPVRLNQFDPVVILLEPELQPLRTLTGIAPKRLAMLNELWKAVPPKKGQPNVALMPVSPDLHGLIPTARKLLTDYGFNVREQNDFKNISRKDTDILIIQDLHIPCRNPDELEQFVREGGSILICGGAALNYHVSNNNGPLLRKFGLQEAGLPTALYNHKAVPPEDNLTVECRDFSQHPISENVRSFVSAGANVLNALPKDAQVILRASADSNRKGHPVIAALKYGRGRVVYLGDRWFLRPVNFEKGDNAQLFHNIVSWLAGKPGRKLSAAELDASLFITSAKLKEAEIQEAAGDFTFEQPASFRSYLHASDELNGIAGGDPVIDLLKGF